jgi:hypothetical protein
MGGSWCWKSSAFAKRYRTGTVQVGLVPLSGSCPTLTKKNNTSILSFSTHDNSTTMAPIDKPIADLKSHEQDKDFSIRGIAKKTWC